MSDDSARSANVFNRFLSPSPQRTQLSATSKTAYVAVTLEDARKGTRRLRVGYGDGCIEVFSYSYLTNMLYEPPDQLGLMFHNGHVRINGRNLALLLDGLQEERVIALHLFDATLYSQPPPDETVITTIEWQPRHDRR